MCRTQLKNYKSHWKQIKNIYTKKHLHTTTYLDVTVNEAKSFDKRKKIYDLIIHQFVDMVKELLNEINKKT